MTKRNAFGNTIHTPEDRPEDFADFAAEMGGGAYSALVSEDELFGWCASVALNEGEDVEVHDFGSRDELVAWLVVAGVPAAEIEDDA